MKVKPSKKPKATRNTLLKSIAAQPTIRRKLDVALGQSCLGDFELDSELALYHLVTKWRVNGKCETLNDPRIITVGAKPDPLIEEYAELGYVAAKAIVEGKHTFFSRLAAMVQFKKSPQPHRLYVDILDFCRWHGGGTQRRPCDEGRLLERLERHGFKFSTNYEGEFPPSLRKTCKALGVVTGKAKP